MNPKRIAAMARKEFFHIRRDPFTLALALVLPFLVVMIFGFAFEFNLNHIPLAVHDADKTSASRQLLRSFASSGHFIVEPVSGPSAVRQALESEAVRAALIIDRGFEKRLARGEAAPVQILVDGGDNTSAASILAYLPEVQRLAGQQLRPEISGRPPLQVKTRFLFNSQLSTAWFIVPGLGVVILAILSILLTSLTIAREWENGSMELLLATPVRPIEIVLGKLLPYLVLGLGAVVFTYAAARLVFGVPFVGSHLLYLLGCLLFVFTCMSQGLLISIVTRAQQISMQAALMSGLLPSMFLSGFIYPIENMPRFFHYFTMILAPRWFMEISRGIYLKGSGLPDLALPFLALVLLAVLIVTLASTRFKKDVEP